MRTEHEATVKLIEEMRRRKQSLGAEGARFLIGLYVLEQDTTAALFLDGLRPDGEGLAPKPE